jgi:predicted amidohydrolase
MRDEVHVALVQMATEWLSPAENRKKILKYIAEVCERSPTDLIVFPELATTGYSMGRDADFNERFIEAAERIRGYSQSGMAQGYLRTGSVLAHGHGSGA